MWRITAAHFIEEITSGNGGEETGEQKGRRGVPVWDISCKGILAASVTHTEDYQGGI